MYKHLYIGPDKVQIDQDLKKIRECIKKESGLNATDNKLIVECIKLGIESYKQHYKIK